MEKIKIGMIGFGGRGFGLLKDIILPNKKAEVNAVCDIYADRTDAAYSEVLKQSGKAPFKSNNYKDIIARDDVELIIVTASWETHIPMAIEAMEAGKGAAIEVGGAYSLEQCFDLVRCAEKTGMPFTMLENCCFGRRELMVLNMAQKGVFGEIVHCEGGYHHDLRNEVAFGKENRHYRLRNYLSRNCENYPTHELGPIAKVLGINHGNRMISLTSTSSKAAGLHSYILDKKADDKELVNAHFNQGDVVTTVIKCANGETITLTLDTTLPRFYSRDFTVRGTKGLYEEATDSIFIDGKDNESDMGWRKQWGNASEYSNEYEHPIWKRYIEEGVQGSHDGMDWLEFDHFFDAYNGKEPFTVDVYDAASWMCITALSEKSIALGSVPVDIPDFTNGMWTMR